MKSFLFNVYDPGKPTGRLPPGTRKDNSLLLYVWNCKFARTKTAVKHALARLELLRARTELDWELDHDMQENNKDINISDLIELWTKKLTLQK